LQCRVETLSDVNLSKLVDLVTKFVCFCFQVDHKRIDHLIAFVAVDRKPSLFTMADTISAIVFLAQNRCVIVDRSIFSSNEEPSTFSDDLVFETFVVGSGTSSAIMVIFSEVLGVD
jgi:hypothetical protein